MVVKMGSEHKWPGSNPDSAIFPKLCDVQMLLSSLCFNFLVREMEMMIASLAS